MCPPAEIVMSVSSFVEYISVSITGCMGSIILPLPVSQDNKSSIRLPTIVPVVACNSKSAVKLPVFKSPDKNPNLSTAVTSNSKFDIFNSVGENIPCEK